MADIATWVLTNNVRQLKVARSWDDSNWVGMAEAYPLPNGVIMTIISSIDLKDVFFSLNEDRICRDRHVKYGVYANPKGKEHYHHLIMNGNPTFGITGTDIGAYLDALAGVL